MKKAYIRIKFSLASPLAVGSGENIVTDKDIVRNSLGEPYIPASSLAGVYRDFFEKDRANQYFGVTLEGTNGLTDSKVIVYDANICEGSRFITKRDMVALDEYKIGIDNAKFDFQVLELGIKMETFIEQNIEDADDCVIEAIAERWLSGDIVVGAKTTRGYGKTKAEISDIKTAEFDLDKEDDLSRWLDFDMYSEEELSSPQSCWKDYERKSIIHKDTKKKVTLHLQQLGGISIRQYSTDVEEADFKQLSLNDSTPVIPGTSWAGAFRHHMEKLGFTKKKQEKVFGKVEQSGEKKGYKSLVGFSESQITGGCDLQYTRNAIDRFSGATLKGALYTEKTHYNGKTVLDIVYDGSCGMEFEQYLAAAICDLNEGYMAVGGLTSIGRGIFRIEKITINDKEELSNEEINYDKLVSFII